MALPDNKACGNCRFWRVWKRQAEGTKPNESYGDCRRRAPAIMTKGQMFTTKFPSTEAAEFCGDYKSSDE